MLAQELRDRQADLVVLADAQRQRAEPAQQQPRFERAERRAEHERGFPDSARSAPVRPSTTPATRSWCPPRYLVPLCIDEIDPELERPLVERRGEGVVRQRDDAACLGERRNGRRSVSCIVGLAGDSTMMRRVRSVESPLRTRRYRSDRRSCVRRRSGAAARRRAWRCPCSGSAARRRDRRRRRASAPRRRSRPCRTRSAAPTRRLRARPAIASTRWWVGLP